MDWLREFDRPPESRRLSVCPLCGLDFVVAVDGTEGHQSWFLLLRCGSCGTLRQLVASDGEVDALCDEIEDGLARLAARAEQLHRDRRETEIEIFVTALERDLISGDDFACGRPRARP